MSNNALLEDLTGELLDFDPVVFIERNLTLKGKPYEIQDCGRDYLFELLRYIAFEAPTEKGVPVVVKKGRQVEMTTTATALSLYFVAGTNYKHVNGLHAFPQIKQAQKHSNKQFDGMVQDSKDQNVFNRRATATKRDGKTINATYSVTQKDFINSNTLYLEGAGLDGDRLRGMQADFTLYDEIQDWPRTAKESTREAMSHSQFGPPGFGMELYFGTPKNVNSDFHDMWEKSDQRHYYLKCIHCGNFFEISLDNFVEGYLVECKDAKGRGCLKRMDKRQAMKGGKWVPHKPENTSFSRGYHIDQLMIPTITREAIDRKIRDDSPRTVANEVFGQFYSGTIDSITMQQVIDWTTTQPDTKNAIMPEFVTDRTTFMGIDWGARAAGEEDTGKGSYTVPVIFSYNMEQKLQLEFATPLATKKVEEQIEVIQELVRKYNVKLIFADYGFGYAQIQRLQALLGREICKAVHSGQQMKRSYAFNEDTNLISIDKFRVMEEWFNYLAQYNVCFPAGELERIEWLWDHICGVEVFSQEVGGMIRKRYKKSKASQPIDGLMACVYAFTAFRYRQTSGFKQLDGKMMQKGRNMPKPVLAHAPRGRALAKLFRGQR